MRRPLFDFLVPLLFLPGCAIERLEAIFNEHGQTYVTTDAQDSDTTAADTTSTGDASTSLASTTSMGTSGASTDDTTGTTTSTTDGDTTPDTTTGAQPICGNGVVEPLASPPEECDDGNQTPDDGCGATCAADRIMFVSSNLYQAGYFESLYLADALCAGMAKDAGYPQWLKFHAWLSDSTTHARDRFKFSRGRIVLVNGLVVANSWIDLLAGKLQTPIEVTEKGETYHGDVWTGTTPQGTAIPGSGYCDDWSSSSLQKTTYYGSSDHITAEWTQSALWDNPQECASENAVYCLEQR